MLRVDLGADGKLGVERQCRRATHDVTPAAAAWADRGNLMARVVGGCLLVYF